MTKLTTQDTLFALDGLYGQIAIAKSYYEGQGVTTLPLDSMAASLATLRAALDDSTEIATSESEEGPCQHPMEARQRTDVGGGNYYILCHSCEEIIEQSGG